MHNLDFKNKNAVIPMLKIIAQCNTKVYKEL